MLTINMDMNKKHFKKFQFLGLILTGFLVSFLPAIVFFLFFVLEKYVFEISHMKEYTLLDIIATSLFYGFLVFMIILFLGKLLSVKYKK